MRSTPPLCTECGQPVPTPARGPWPERCAACRQARKAEQRKASKRRLGTDRAPMRMLFCARCGQGFWLQGLAVCAQRYCSRSCKLAVDAERQRSRVTQWTSDQRQNRRRYERQWRRTNGDRIAAWPSRSTEARRRNRKPDPRGAFAERWAAWKAANPDKVAAYESRRNERAITEMALRQALRELMRPTREAQARERRREAARRWYAERQPRTHCRNGHPLGPDHSTCWTCIELMRKSACVKGHDLTLPNARRNGGDCRQCHRDRESRRRAKQRYERRAGIATQSAFRVERAS